jgi:hypothetical protein
MECPVCGERQRPTEKYGSETSRAAELLKDSERSGHWFRPHLAEA